MVCPKCQTVQSDNTQVTCSTCGASLSAESDLATRVVSTNDPAARQEGAAAESDVGTRVIPKQANAVQTPPSLESDADAHTRRIEQGSRSPMPGVPFAAGSGLHGWTSGVDAAGAVGALCLLPGVVLGGRYEVLKSLGEGGMGSVYQARDLEVNRVVAIKIIRPELANDPAIVQRFKQELVLARQVTHRNVVRIYDLGVASGLRFISMEYIDGDELSNILQERGKFDPKTAAEIVVQVCRGLEAAHSQGVIHRDLKPQNIMLDRQGRAAVMDFGIARSAELSVMEELASEETATQEYGLTQVGSLIGTPRYMSPEQAQGQRVDARSDIYTVGIIFYELLTGRLPFSAPSVKELLRRRGKDRARPVTELEPSVPKRLNEVVLKCLESRPEDRYQSVSDLILDLEVWLGIRTPPGARRTNRWTAFALSVALLAVMFSAYLVHDRMALNAAKAHRPVTVLIADFQNGTGKPVLSGVVEPMFQVAIEGSSFISAFNRGQEHKLAATIQPGSKSVDEHLGRLIAIREGVGVIVGGAVESHGNGYRLSAKAIDPNGKVLLTESSDFSQLNDLPKAVDKAAEGVRRVLGDSTHSSTNSAAETFTSGSLASAQEYATAQQLQWEGKWTEAVAAYREATVLDPKMSRAYAGMAATLANQGNRQQAAHYYQLALAHIDRESEREKFRTRGGYYLLMRDYQKAAEQFGQLIKEYPVDSAGLANLALAYFYGRNMKAALEEGRKAVKIYPQNILQRNNLGLYAMYAGDFDSAIKESEIILKMNPSFEKAYLCLGISQLQRGSVAEAEGAFQKLTTLSKWGASEGALALGDLAIYEGRYSDAIQVLEKGISSDLEQKNEVPASVKLVALADAELGHKQRGAALKSAARAAASNEDESVLYGAARVDVQAGSPADALLLAKRLSNRFEPEPRALSKLIEGEVEMEGGRLHEAVASFQEAQKLADTWIGRYDLGRAYLAAKLYPDAENEFEICVKRRGEASAIFLDDEPTMRYLPAVYYYLGVAKSGLGSAGAAEQFKTFVTIKQRGEPDATVADAKRKLNTP